MNEPNIRVWDPLIRVFHWTLVASFTVAYFSEDDLVDVHVYAGYTVGALLLFRLFWGFVGTRHARFSDFLRSPKAVLDYLKDELALRARRYIGHNPAGGAMIIALLVSLGLMTLSGLAVYGVQGNGPLAGSMGGLGGGWEETFEEVHEIFANLTLFLIVLHVSGVVLSSLLHGENLVRAMITGEKRAE